MGIARSTFYDLPTTVHDDTAIVEAIAAICDEFEFYALAVKSVRSREPER